MINKEIERVMVKKNWKMKTQDKEQDSERSLKNEENDNM